MELILYVWLAFVVVGLGVSIWAVRRLVSVTRHGLSTASSRDRKNGKSAATDSSDAGLWMGAAMIGSSDSSATFSVMHPPMDVTIMSQGIRPSVVLHRSITRVVLIPLHPLIAEAALSMAEAFRVVAAVIANGGV